VSHCDLRPNEMLPRDFSIRMIPSGLLGMGDVLWSEPCIYKHGDREDGEIHRE
jgi:hypothetical protein